jgi:hypothetical protein
MILELFGLHVGASKAWDKEEFEIRYLACRKLRT